MSANYSKHYQCYFGFQTDVVKVLHAWFSKGSVDNMNMRIGGGLVEIVVMVEHYRIGIICKLWIHHTPLKVQCTGDLAVSMVMLKWELECLFLCTEYVTFSVSPTVLCSHYDCVASWPHAFHLINLPTLLQWGHPVLKGRIMSLSTQQNKAIPHLDAECSLFPLASAFIARSITS